MTLVTPRHNVRSPSNRYIVETAFDMPVYSPPAVGLMICIRVYPHPLVSQCDASVAGSPHLHQIHWIHHRVLLDHQSISRVCTALEYCIPQCRRRRPPTCCDPVHSCAAELRSCNGVSTGISRAALSQRCPTQTRLQVEHQGCSAAAYSVRAAPQGISLRSPLLLQVMNRPRSCQCFRDLRCLLRTRDHCDSNTR